MRALPGRFVCTIVPFMFAILATAGEPSSRTLTFQQRVDAQRILDRLEYSHTIGATRPFEEVIPIRNTEERVRGSMARSAALESYWKTPITQDVLQKELERIARETRLPERLTEIYMVLGYDPFLVREAFVRPLLAERLVRGFVSADERIQALPRKQAEQLRTDLMTGRLSRKDPHPLRRLDDRPGDEVGATRPVIGTVGAIIDGHDAFRFEIPIEQGPHSVKVAVYRIAKISFDQWWRSEPRRPVTYSTDADTIIDDRLPQPVVARDSQASVAGLTTTDAWDNGSLDDIPSGRTDHSAVWTGNLMIIWGGSRLNSGGRYDPVTDTWSPTSTLGAPSPRSGHTAIWTGQEMIVWGGAYGNNARYNPVSDSWTSVSTTLEPVPRSGHTAVWTGNRMIIWGGTNFSSVIGTGGIYDPLSDTWEPTTLTDAPEARHHHTAVWTGTEMLVWGGESDTGLLQTGARFQLSPQSWTPISTTGAPVARIGHSAIWTGSRMVVWGGDTFVNFEATGGQYDPGLDTWVATSTATAPAARTGQTAVWTGSRMIVWGGYTVFGSARTGGQYDPANNAWTVTSTTNSPSQRQYHTAVWTGSLMVVWGGEGAGNTGGRYDPLANSWTPTATTAAGDGPAIWTGSEMIVFSRAPRSGRYNPLTDTWAPLSTLNHPLGGTAVWTGTEMITWNGHAGARFNPVSDTWTQISTAGAPLISPSFGLGFGSAVWTGQEMIVFGGDTGGGGFELSPTNIGGRYNPATNSWVQTPLTDAPTPRVYHKAVWTGTAMIVWGGVASFGQLQPDGASFNPSTGLWTPISTIGDPDPRTNHIALWTGSEMIVWGGAENQALGDGARYDPAQDSWSPVSIIDSPSSRWDHTAVWSGTEMIIWGGESDSGVQEATGGRYNPMTDSWTQVTTVDAPAGMSGHAAVWTGDSMIVWSGNGGGRYFPQGVPPTNEPPQAVILGGGQHVECAGSALLDGSQSSDPEGGSLTYEWFAEASTAPPVGTPPSGTGPTFNVSGSVYSPPGPITLRVTDPGGATGTATTFVNVSDTIPPQVNCPAPITAECAGPAYTYVNLPGVTAHDSCVDDIIYGRTEDPYNVPFASNNFVYGTTIVTIDAKPTFGPPGYCYIAVTVQDTVPPTISASLTPNLLWPANHNLVEVVASVTASDTCGASNISLKSVTSNEPDDAPGNSDGSTTGDIREAAIGTPDFRFLVRAERAENGVGRTYTITYEVIDGAGLRSTASALVTVPLQRVKVKPR